jgi:hypothetical protein
MMELACTWVRDRLPEHARDALDVADGARIEQHLATCAECRAEAALVTALATPVTPPADLESRVIRAVRAEPIGVRRGGGAAFRHYALAASFVFAVVTGSLLWQQFGGTGAGQIPDPETDVALAVPAGTDPLLHESGLQALSEDELRTLLEELES